MTTQLKLAYGRGKIQLVLVHSSICLSYRVHLCHHAQGKLKEVKSEVASLTEITTNMQLLVRQFEKYATRAEETHACPLCHRRWEELVLV